MKQSRRVSIAALGPYSFAAVPLLFLSSLPACGAKGENAEEQATNALITGQADAKALAEVGGDAGCVAHPSTLMVQPSTSGPVTLDALVHYDIVIADNDVGSCAPRTYRVRPSPSNGPPDPTLNFFLDRPPPFQNVKPGTTAIVGVNVIATESAALGVRQQAFIVDGFPEDAPANTEHLDGQLTFLLVAPSGCFVYQRQELIVTDPSVVDDPVRTFGSSNPVSDAGPPGEGGVILLDGGMAGPAPASAQALALGREPRAGVWSFAHLLRQMAPRPELAPAMTLRLLQHWLADQTVNGFVVPARSAMQQQLLDIWPRTAGGDLDLDQAPLTLQAIVNRIDIRNLAAGSAGEGRFIFGVNGPGNLGRFTVILEYNLRASTERDVLRWAKRWHALSSHPFPSEEYNAALERITRSFTDRNAAPGNVNGSALVELRTNEIALAPVWELRGFLLSATTGFFEETTVKETPDLGFKGTQTLADFVNANAASIKAVLPGANSSTVPAQFGGRSFLAGAVQNDLTPWNAPGIVDPDARFHLSINSCNGCHGSETNTAFLMILPRPVAGSEAQLAPFITGTAALDPFSGQLRVLYDLGRRQADLTSLVCPPDEVPPPPFDAGASPGN